MSQYETGSVFAIPILETKKYVFGKYLHLKHLTGHEYNSHLFKVYNYISTKSEIPLKKIIKSDLLFGPLRLDGPPKIRKLGWKMLELNLCKEDDFFPDYVSLRIHPKTNKPTRYLERYYIQNKNQNSSTPLDNFDMEERTTHLEYSTFRVAISISNRIYLEYLRQQGISLEQKARTNEYLNIEYDLMKDIPIYSSIPSKYRGRILPKGVRI